MEGSSFDILDVAWAWRFIILTSASFWKPGNGWKEDKFFDILGKHKL
jgi:hypothetical protein